MNTNPEECCDRIDSDPVLVVDDDEKLLRILAESLENRGFRVLRAISTREAVSQLEGNRISVLLVDWHLGSADAADQKTDGTAAAIINEARKRDENVPVMVMSGLKDVAVWNDAALQGADSFFSKPISMQTLTPALLRWIKRRQREPSIRLPKQEEDIWPLEVVKQEYVKSAVECLSGNVSLASQKLGVHRHTTNSILEAAARERKEE
jgi:ActR/RegA family two-component response regulator